MNVAKSCGLALAVLVGSVAAGCSAAETMTGEEADGARAPAEVADEAAELAAGADERVRDTPGPRTFVVRPEQAAEAIALFERLEGWTYAYDEVNQVMVATAGATTMVLDQEALQSLAASDEAAASPWGIACRAACWGAAALGCAVVSVTCAVGSFITIGGTAIPCAWAIVAACTASGAGASICSDTLCPP